MYSNQVVCGATSELSPVTALLSRAVLTWDICQRRRVEEMKTRMRVILQKVSAILTIPP